MAEQSPIDFGALFDAMPTPLLVLTPDLVIVTANVARLAATGHRLDDIVGRPVFEVFPDDPAEPEADGVAMLRASLERVLATKKPDTMPVQRRDLPVHEGGHTRFVTRVECPVNVPVLDAEGRVVLLLHRVEDVTDLIHDPTVADRPAGVTEGDWERRVQAIEADLFARARELGEANERLRGADHREAEAGRRLVALSETLQRSLLTAPPEPDHLHIAVRYLPAVREAQVGGDWFDAFVTPDGSTSIVVGDVTGHDQYAVAAMGQVRNILRGVAFTLVKPPAAVLSALDRALRGLDVGTLATVVLATIEQPREGVEPGTRRLRWSSAGHLPPLLLQPDRPPELLARTPNMLLGIRPEAPRDDHEMILATGATLVLYTDGLVERRDASLDAGLERLRASAEHLSHLPLEEMCDALLEAMAPVRDDDVALAAVRAHPQD